MSSILPLEVAGRRMERNIVDVFRVEQLLDERSQLSGQGILCNDAEFQILDQSTMRHIRCPEIGTLVIDHNQLGVDRRIVLTIHVLIEVSLHGNRLFAQQSSQELTIARRFVPIGERSCDDANCYSPLGGSLKRRSQLIESFGREEWTQNYHFVLSHTQQVKDRHSKPVERKAEIEILVAGNVRDRLGDGRPRSNQHLRGATNRFDQ